MMTTINGVILAGGSSLAALIVVKITLVAALGLAAAWLARRGRAAVRHALLAVTFGAMLLLPIASIFAPSVHVTVPAAEVSRVAWPHVLNSTAPISPAITADGAHVAPAAPLRSSTVSLSVLLLAGWIVGTAVFLAPVMTGLWQIRSLRRSCLPWLDGQSIAEALAFDAGIHRRVELLLDEALPGPITCGILHPAIILPRDAASWAREDLSRAIVHELEHVRRGDSATRCLARAVCAAYWFHPVVWIAWRKLVLEAELSCDDAVLRRSEATAYADQLVGLAKRLPTSQRSPLLAMASRSDLSARVGAVLDNRRQRGRAGAISVALACVAASALVVALAPVMLVASPQSASPQSDVKKWVGLASAERAAANRAATQFLIDRLRQAERQFRAALQRDGDVEPLRAEIEDVRKSLESVQGVERIKGDVDQTRAIAAALSESQLYDRKIGRIEIRGLSDAVAEDLISRLPVHKGDTLTGDLMQRINETAKDLDWHLEPFVSVEPDGSCSLQVRRTSGVRWVR
jgi:beta-lactamase regulating signal transducer with metallopeptidase domain